MVIFVRKSVGILAGVLAITMGIAMAQGSPTVLNAQSDLPRQDITDSLLPTGPLQTNYDPASLPEYPYGLYTISGAAENISDKTFTDLVLVITHLSGGNLVLECDGGVPMGAGCEISIPDSQLGGDGLLSPGEIVEASGTVGLLSPVPFQLGYQLWAMEVNDQPEPAPEVPGVLLGGEPAAQALSATFDLVLESGIPPEDIGTDESEREVTLTQLEIVITEETTVGELNDLLESINARIVSMFEGLDILLIEFPNPGSVAGLDAIVAVLEASPIILDVDKAFFPSFERLPNNHDAGDPSILRIGHHISAKAPAAWNASDALLAADELPLLIIADAFGGGVPNDAFNVNATAADFPFSDPQEHGYHVLGIIAAQFGGDVTDRGQATGIVPAQVDVRAIDIMSTGGAVGNAWVLNRPLIQNRLIASIKSAATDRNVVVNTSLGFDCKTPAKKAVNCNANNARKQAAKWIKKVRHHGLESKFVHVTTAGNVNVPGDTLAEHNSEFAAARLYPDITWYGAPIPNLTNTVVVESYDYGEGFEPNCLYDLSKRSGNIAASGIDVWSLTGANAGADFMTGTSMATPQVAGAVLGMWGLQSSNGPDGVIAALLAASRPGLAPVAADNCASGVTSAPVLDAYATLLAADNKIAILSETDVDKAPVRGVILDVTDSSGTEGASNEKFDENDIELFLSKFDAGSSAAIAGYGRYDLNGDGWTGSETGKARFDLDIDNPPSFETVEAEIIGTTVSFDEAAVTDIEVLCFYSYSTIFDGNESERDDLLDGKCGAVEPGVVIKPLSTYAGADYLVSISNPDRCTVSNRLAEEQEPPLTIKAECSIGTFIEHELTQPSENELVWNVDADNKNGGRYSGSVRFDMTVAQTGTFRLELNRTWGDIEVRSINGWAGVATWFVSGGSVSSLRLQENMSAEPLVYEFEATETGTYSFLVQAQIIKHGSFSDYADGTGELARLTFTPTSE